MRILLTLWFLPLVLFWGWYGLSANDISFGINFFSREVHDLVFLIYGNATGIHPAEIPGILAGACIFDSLIVVGIAAFRWRNGWVPQAKEIIARFWNQDRVNDFPAEDLPVGRVHPAE